MRLIKTGLCAFGMSGKVFHAPFLHQHPGFELYGIVERHRNEAQEKYPQVKTFRAVDDLLNDPEIELVIVNTPVQTHFEYAKMALDAGKHVIVEKPFTVDATEAVALVKHAEKLGLSLSVYQNRRFDRDFLQVQNILKSGKLGQIREVEIRFNRYRTQPSQKIHKEDVSLPGAGALHDLGAHLVDQALQLFGFPSKVFADVFSMKGEAYANDYFEVILFYPDHLRVKLKSSSFVKESHWAYNLHGERGSFLQERSDNQEAELASGSIPNDDPIWQEAINQSDGILNYDEMRSETISAPGNYMNYYQEIYEHLVFGTEIPSPGREIINNMKIIDAALQSSHKGKIISL